MTKLTDSQIEYIARFAKSRGVTVQVEAERERQHQKWGEQNHPNGTGPHQRTVVHSMGSVSFERLEAQFKAMCDARARHGVLTWIDVLLEEVFEAAAEADPAKLKAELVQVAAVAVAWIEALERKEALARTTARE
jgi:hypothetical protein